MSEMRLPALLGAAKKPVSQPRRANGDKLPALGGAIARSDSGEAQAQAAAGEMLRGLLGCLSEAEQKAIEEQEQKQIERYVHKKHAHFVVCPHARTHSCQHRRPNAHPWTLARARARRESLIAAAQALEASRLVKLSETNKQDKAKVDERTSKREAHILKRTLHGIFA
jgi:hypothetical protein